MSTASHPGRVLTAGPGRPPIMSRRQKATLVGMFSSDPSAPTREVHARFVERTGCPISLRLAQTLRPKSLRIRRRKAAPVVTPCPRAGYFADLNPSQADALAWIVANRTDLTANQCVALLAAEIEHQSRTEDRS